MIEEKMLHWSSGKHRFDSLDTNPTPPVVQKIVKLQEDTEILTEIRKGMDTAKEQLCKGTEVVVNTDTEPLLYGYVLVHTTDGKQSGWIKEDLLKDKNEATRQREQLKILKDRLQRE